MSRRHRRPHPAAAGLLPLLALLLVVLPGCSLRRVAVNAVASTMASGGDLWSSDPDPELVRDALPFALKTIEALVAQAPDDPRLRVAAASGFTQYAFAFVEGDADAVEATDPAAADALRRRAKGLYLRARDHGMHGLEATLPGIGDRLSRDPVQASAELDRDDVPLGYWTAAAWGAAMAASQGDPALVADLGVVRAMMERLLVLDEAWGGGSIHEAMIAISALPEVMGGSPARAREHFERAVALSGGHRVSPYLAMARLVAVPAQDRAGFEQLLDAALAIDVDAAPSERLANILGQRRAEALRLRADELFLDDASVDDEEDGEAPAQDDAGTDAETPAPVPGTAEEIR